MLITQAYDSHGCVVFRWHAFGCPIVARKRKGHLYEERACNTRDPDVKEKVLVRLEGEHMNEAIAALVIAGYADDPRAPKWLAELMKEAEMRLTTSSPGLSKVRPELVNESGHVCRFCLAHPVPDGRRTCGRNACLSAHLAEQKELAR